jgi:hypothetical protein
LENVPAEGQVIERIIGGLNLRYPTAFVLLVVLTVADVLFPDLLPFVDEIGLALLTVLFGLWRRRREPAETSGGARRDG